MAIHGVPLGRSNLAGRTHGHAQPVALSAAPERRQRNEATAGGGCASNTVPAVAQWSCRSGGDRESRRDRLPVGESGQPAFRGGGGRGRRAAGFSGDRAKIGLAGSTLPHDLGAVRHLHRIPEPSVCGPLSRCRAVRRSSLLARSRGHESGFFRARGHESGAALVSLPSCRRASRRQGRPLGRLFALDRVCIRALALRSPRSPSAITSQGSRRGVALILELYSAEVLTSARHTLE